MNGLGRWETLWRLLKFAWPYRLRLTIGIVAGLLSGGALFGVLSSVKNLIRPFEGPPKVHELVGAPGADKLDRLVQLAQYLDIPVHNADGNDSWQFYLLAASGIVFFFLVQTLAAYCNRYYMRWVGARAVMDLRNELFSHLQSQSLGFFGRSDIGQMISRVVSDTTQVQTAIAVVIADICKAPFEILAAGIFVVVTSVNSGLYSASITLFFVVPVCIIPIVILGRRIRKHTKVYLERIADLISRMHETFSGIRLVKACNMEVQESRRFADLNLGYFKRVIRAMRAELLMTPAMELIGVTVGCILLAVCYAHDIRFSEILPLGMAAWMVYRPMKQLAKINNELQRTTAAGQRIFELLGVDESLPLADNPLPIEAFTDSIRFERVAFKYEDDGPPVLHCIDLEIKKGQVVAFVGQTGSGKTTLANLLARFYDPTAGRVTLDGIDLRQFDLAALRRMMGIVTQDTILFNDTIANNIAYGLDGISREQIAAAARQANAEEFILAEAEGYDRVVGEKGFRLSGGQRQRLAIARAILRNPQILILDEAMSALDTVTEQLVNEALEHLMANRTVFAIAHRLSTVRRAACIYVLDEGRIVEHGSHEELMALDARYRQLYDLQLA